jgi:ketosteroid isomerase-like protein
VRAMSQQNVELAHRLMDAWNQRDLEALGSLIDPDVEFVNSPTAVEPGIRRGALEVAAVAEAQWQMLLDGRQEIDRTYDRGDEIITLGRVSRRMPGSEERIEDRFLSSVTFRDGKATRIEVLGFGATEVADALRSAGLDG